MWGAGSKTLSQDLGLLSLYASPLRAQEGSRQQAGHWSNGHCSCRWARPTPLLGGPYPSGDRNPVSPVLNALFPLGQCWWELLSGQTTRV